MSEFLCLFTTCSIFFAPFLLLILLSRRNTQLKRFAAANGMVYEPGLFLFKGARAIGEEDGVRVRIRVQHNWYRHSTRRKRQTFAVTLYEADLRGVIPPRLSFRRPGFMERSFRSAVKVGLEDVDTLLVIYAPDAAVAHDFFLRPAVRRAAMELAGRDDSTECEAGILRINHLFAPGGENQIRQHLELIVWAAKMIRGDYDQPNQNRNQGQAW